MPIKTICVYGAGALGGAIAAKLPPPSEAMSLISVVARGAHLAAIRDKGLTLFRAGAESTDYGESHCDRRPGRPATTGSDHHRPEGSTSSAQAAEGMAGLLKDDTRVVMILNGIPWWYFHRDEHPEFAELQFEELDPGGACGG
jgi:2-dehydropantoate 2-reductase